MKYPSLIFILVFVLSCTIADGQDVKRKNFFPIWSYHQKNINIHGVSLGLWTGAATPRFTNTNGVKIELIGVGLGLLLMPHSPIADDDSSYAQMVNKPISEKINGLSLSATGTACHCKTNGISVGAIGQINFQVNGLAASFIANFSQKHNGMMIALGNEAYEMNGLQVGLANDAHRIKGVQIGLHNGGTEMKGVQLGLINKSSNFRGIQIGIWNVNQKRKLPFFNWNF